MHDIIRQLDDKRSAARLGGGEKRIAAQHAKGSSPRVSASSCSSIRARSKNGTCSRNTVAPTSAWKNSPCRAMVW